MRALEETQRGGKPFPDHDSKLTRQFLRGINEEVYMRIAPMKPWLLSFQELQDELRNLSKETRRFQSLNMSKKTYAQFQVALECNLNMKAEKAKHSSEWSCRKGHTSPSSAFKQLKPMVARATMGKQQDPPLQVSKTGDNQYHAQILAQPPHPSGTKLQPSKIPIEGAAGQSVTYHGVPRECASFCCD